MAKLGNEAKLVLKLVGERLAQQETAVRNKATNSSDYCNGFSDCRQWVEAEIRNVQLELEAK